MYKIYINENPILLCSTLEYEGFEHRNEWECYRYNGRIKTMPYYIDSLEKASGQKRVLVYFDDLSRLKSDFKKMFKKLTAAGGVILNNEGEILFIYRRGFWDLPKGKMESGEQKRECAHREVLEETGLTEVSLGKKIVKTRHTYRHPKTGERVLKITHWYEMHKEGDQELHLQAEEEITDAKWMKLNDFFAEKYATFASITFLLKEYELAKKEIEG